MDLARHIDPGRRNAEDILPFQTCNCEDNATRHCSRESWWDRHSEEVKSTVNNNCQGHVHACLDRQSSHAAYQCKNSHDAYELETIRVELEFDFFRIEDVSDESALRRQEASVLY